MSQVQKAENTNMANKNNETVDMKDIVALCKRRGFIFQASDIYGGINGFWDYGPLGVELKNNLRDLWWKTMVTTPPVGPDGEVLQIVGLDSSIIQNPKTWEASGHVGGFSDPMVDCKETKKRYRADHLTLIIPSTEESPFISSDPEKLNEAIKEYEFKGDLGVLKDIPIILAFNNDDITDNPDLIFKKHKKIYKKLGTNLPAIFAYRFIELEKVPSELYSKIIAPDTYTPGTLTEPKEFNLMFHTYVGATASEDNKAYLRPETAQGIFLNFKNVMDSSRVRMPFGIAQIGKAFRNEVTPRNFIYRSREFEQMEMQFFCHSDDAEKWYKFWFEERNKFWKSIGISDDSLAPHEHSQKELAHYAKNGLGAIDIEYKFPFTAPGYGELEGIHDRCTFDLTQHQEFSGQKLQHMDPHTQEWYTPHVIETAAGLTRGVLALICEAYTVDPNRPSGAYLNLHPSIAPKKAAILPLTAKEDHVPLATKLYMELREEFPVDLDIKQSIGKRYARQDEIGTPFCFTIDNDSIADQTVTVRHRNTMKQERIAMSNVAEYMRKEMAVMAG